MNITIIGLGYVGLVNTLFLASKGHNIFALDINKNKVATLKAGKTTINEPHFQELLTEYSSNIRFTTNHKDALRNANMIFICVDTPQGSDGSVNTTNFYNCLATIKESITNDVSIIIRSTVPVGTNKLTCDYFLDSPYKVDVISFPEFLSQGKAFEDLTNPMRLVFGVNDQKGVQIAKSLTTLFDIKKIPVMITTPINAELIKYASNSFLAMKISYINNLAQLCDAVGGDIDKVSTGMGLDPRIGSSFLNAGIGYGGSCFPKDTKALHWLSKELERELKTVSACIEVNKRQKIILYEYLKELLIDLENKNIGVLGLTFKPGTDDLREAASIDNVELLLDSGANVKAYDPISTEKFKEKIKLFVDEDKVVEKINYYTDIDDTIKDCDAVLIMTEWPQIKEYDLNKYEELMKNPLVLDGRNCYNLKDVEKTKVKYLSIGRKRINFDKK